HDQAAVGAELDEKGFIAALVLDDGQRLDADFFIDCSDGFLLQDVLKTGHEDWSRWLPVNRFVSVVTAPDPQPPPYTSIKADAAGWQWRMPLRDGCDNGYAYCSDLLDDDAAFRSFPRGTLGEPRRAQFTAGRPKKFWNKNCVALPGGFL